MLNHRGQVGETMTWIVATVVVITILALSILAVTSDSFGIKNYRKFNSNRKADLVATKSLVNYISKEGIYGELKGGQELKEEFKEELEKLYKEEYNLVDMRFFYEDAYSAASAVDVLDDPKCSIEPKLYLIDKKWIELCLEGPK